MIIHGEISESTFLAKRSRAESLTSQVSPVAQGLLVSITIHKQPLRCKNSGLAMRSSAE
jgi:hypothetical protein